MVSPNLPLAQPAEGPGTATGPLPPPTHRGWQAVAVDTVISEKPIVLYGAIVTAVPAAPAVVAFYDGVNALAARSFRVAAVAGTSRPIDFGRGLLFQHGLFIDVDAGTLEALVLYEPAVS